MTLLPGELPPALPFELPLPESTTVIGSLVRQAETGGAQIEIILDVGQSAQAVKDFFKERLAEQGFVAGDEMEGEGGVFVSAPDLQVVTLAMCYEEKDLVLWMNAFEMESRPTEVRLNIQTEAEYSPCAREDQGRMPQSHSELLSVLPQLTAPQGARMLGGGSGSSSTSYPAIQVVYASADLETELSPEALAGHFESQIEQAGWQLVESGHTASAAWSTWTFARDGSPWSGMLIILAYGSDPEFKFVMLRAEQAE